MYCSNCGKEILDSAKFCDSCGTKVDTNNSNDEVIIQSGSDSENYQNDYSNYSSEEALEIPEKTNTFAIVGFILSIISQLINFFGLVGIAATIVSIIALIKVKESNEKGKGLAIAGIVLGSFSILYGVYSVMNLSYYF